MSQAITNKDKTLTRSNNLNSPEHGRPFKKNQNLFFLSLAGAALLGSTLLAISHNGKKKMLGHFIGLLVPSLLTLGLYNKTQDDQENNTLTVVKH